MGVIGAILGNPSAAQAVGAAASSVAEVFTPNATKQMEKSHDAYMAALDEHGEEFKHARAGSFDAFVNGLNRVPRPMLALGTLGLFVYAMIDPGSFAERMVGLGYVPEPLWWLLGAIVSFYFGAREAHYFRARGGDFRAQGGAAAAAPQAAAVAAPVEDNPALAEWRRMAG
ncbi:MAG: holin family protein [Defluviimonas sp.]|nr:holin family protein [Defluviimonas sp.]